MTLSCRKRYLTGPLRGPGKPICNLLRVRPGARPTTVLLVRFPSARCRARAPCCWLFLARAATLGADPPAALPYSAELVRQVVEDAQAHGDAHRGAQVFRAATSACMSCHRVCVSGMGGWGTYTVADGSFQRAATHTSARFRGTGW